jgi:hypothetical protein
MRRYKLSLPILVEDEDNPNAVALQSRVTVRVDANDPQEAIEHLRNRIEGQLPNVMTIVSEIPMDEHVLVVVTWPVEQNIMVTTGVYAGLCFDTRTLRLFVGSDASLRIDVPFTDISTISLHDNANPIALREREIHLMTAGAFEHDGREPIRYYTREERELVPQILFQPHRVQNPDREDHNPA